MIVVGVTGVVGSGKSTVSRMFATHGAVVLDADRIAHELMRPRTAVWRAIVNTFGRSILKADGTINRAVLAQQVFGSTRARKTLERMIHPGAIRTIQQELKRLTKQRRVSVVVLDVPLLIEAGMTPMVDVLVVVTAPATVRQQRLQRRGYTKEDMTRRAAAQLDLSVKIGMADAVIENAGSRTNTRQQVEALWKRLKKSGMLKARRKSRG